MAMLKEKLPLPERRDEIVGACCTLLDEEVGRKKGFSGLALKAGYKVFKAFKPTAVKEAVEALFDDFIQALEPFHAEFVQGTAGSGFGSFLKTRASRVAEALVKVTDQRAAKSKVAVLVKGYQTLRPHALRSVEEAVPGLGDLMDRYYSVARA